MMGKTLTLTLSADIFSFNASSLISINILKIQLLIEKCVYNQQQNIVFELHK